MCCFQRRSFPRTNLNVKQVVTFWRDVSWPPHRCLVKLASARAQNLEHRQKNSISTGAWKPGDWVGTSGRPHVQPALTAPAVASDTSKASADIKLVINCACFAPQWPQWSAVCFNINGEPFGRISRYRCTPSLINSNATTPVGGRGHWLFRNPLHFMRQTLLCLWIVKWQLRARTLRPDAGMFSGW